jgi:hypothetical protein
VRKGKGKGKGKGKEKEYFKRILFLLDAESVPSK